jgi:WD40 repeat protein
VAVSPDGDRAAWSSDGYLPTIVTANNVPILTMGPQGNRHTGEIRALSFSRDGSDLYSAATDGFVRRWTVGTGKFLADLPDSDRHALQSLLVTSDLVAAGETAGGSGARVKVWASQQKDPVVLDGASATIAAMAYDRPSQLFFAGSTNGQVLVWRLTGEPGAVLHPIRTDAPATEPVQSLAIVSGARLIAAYAHAIFSWLFSNTDMNRPEGFRAAPPISGAAAIGGEHSGFLAVGKGSDRSIQIWGVLQ